jgi:hypothetical protein
MIAGLAPVMALADAPAYTGPTWTAPMGRVITIPATNNRVAVGATLTGSIDFGSASFGQDGYIFFDKKGIERTITGPVGNNWRQSGDEIDIIDFESGKTMAKGTLDLIYIGTSAAKNTNALGGGSIFETGISGGFGLMPYGVFGAKNVVFKLDSIAVDPDFSKDGNDEKEPVWSDFQGKIGEDYADEAAAKAAFEKAFEDWVFAQIETAGRAFIGLGVDTGKDIVNAAGDIVIGALPIPNPPAQLALTNVAIDWNTTTVAAARTCEHYDVNLKGLTWTTAEMEAIAQLYKNGGNLKVEFTLCNPIGKDAAGTGGTTRWTINMGSRVDVLDDNAEGIRQAQYIETTTAAGEVPYLLIATKEYGYDHTVKIVNGKVLEDKIVVEIDKQMMFSNDFDWNVVWLGLRPFTEQASFRCRSQTAPAAGVIIDNRTVTATNNVRLHAHRGLDAVSAGYRRTTAALATPGAILATFTVSDRIKTSDDWKVADAITALRMSIGAIAEDLAFDVDGDGKITVKDAQAILLLAIA